MSKQKHFTEEERKEARKETWKKYNKTHNYLQRIKIENPILYRATILIQNYWRKDKKKHRGKGDLTVGWLIENILLKPCAHCGKTGWDKIGCNRIDNSKPHTKDNVEPCCEDCNNELNYNELRKKVYQYSLDGELIAIWGCTKDAVKELGYKSPSSIVMCCNGNIKSAYGYIWSYDEK